MKQSFVLVLLPHRDTLNGSDIHLLQATTVKELCTVGFGSFRVMITEMILHR